MSDEDRIRQRAHEIWEQEGRPQGRQEAHWARASREMAEQAAAAPPSDLAGAAHHPGIGATLTESPARLGPAPVVEDDAGPAPAMPRARSKKAEAPAASRPSRKARR
ncbi:DUF2934 domain-containing protein [Falsiroseomonas tokyonensis]|uniref:DUF2934 domain-containing protein n=1 Tax=Falsiroseomonas tokyonensis TaxID=430521 RepID=A0ABV7BYY6_9PROT|nr:DUF2934 domain-containing protein [Falsiroseomonas tokyonensis]MBU8539852.1 DUF2934 domain-containing protein [Falsiroseomonas tokyonensis]